MTDKQKIARLVAALRPFAEHRSVAVEGSVRQLAIGSNEPDAVVYKIETRAGCAPLCVWMFDEAIAAIDAAERKEAGNG